MPRQKITPAGPMLWQGRGQASPSGPPTPRAGTEMAAGLARALLHPGQGLLPPSASPSPHRPSHPRPSPVTQPSDAHSSAPAGARVTGCGLQPPSPGSRQAHSTWQPGEGRGSEAQPISSRPTSSVTPATPSFFISKRGAAITSTASICLQGGWGQGSGSRGSRQGGGRARGWGWGW